MIFYILIPIITNKRVRLGGLDESIGKWKTKKLFDACTYAFGNMYTLFCGYFQKVFSYIKS